MSSFKADSHFEAHVDDWMQVDEYTAAEDVCEYKDLRSVRSEWTTEYTDELLELYTLFTEHGTQVFGRAFFQLGTVSDFCQFVFKHTIPMGY